MKNKILILVTSIVFLGCPAIPFPTCETPGAVRCNGQIAERCEGSHWYVDMDCSDVQQECHVDIEESMEVVRCR